jgi:hypothetical protein
MLPMPLPVAGERQALPEFLKYHHTAFLAVSHGLTDEQARRAAAHLKVTSPAH